MKHSITTTLCLLCAIVAWGGHIMIDGAYTSPDDGVSIYPGTTRTFQVYVPDQYDGQEAKRQQALRAVKALPPLRFSQLYHGASSAPRSTLSMR